MQVVFLSDSSIFLQNIFSAVIVRTPHRLCRSRATGLGIRWAGISAPLQHPRAVCVPSMNGTLRPLAPFAAMKVPFSALSRIYVLYRPLRITLDENRWCAINSALFWEVVMWLRFHILILICFSTEYKHIHIIMDCSKWNIALSTAIS